MATIKAPRWLKKYTRLEHLSSVLEKRQLHLGDPAHWDDKNDSELIQIYSHASGAVETRSACLTGAADRYHFWAVFGENTKGVCLWFDRDDLLSDIQKDQTLMAGPVQYMSASKLSKLKLRKIPFAKREQYADEQEFRVLRRYSSRGPSTDGFGFSVASLKRIYLNPWLTGKALNREKVSVWAMLEKGYKHVELYQNRTLKKQAWIEAAKSAAKTSS